MRFCDRENPSGVLRKGLAQLVHHVLFMLHEGMGVAAEGDGGVFVPQNFRKGLDVHAAFERARGEGVAERMKAFPLDAQSFLQQLETSLVGAYGQGLSVVRYHVFRTIPLLLLFEQGQELFGQRDRSFGGRRLGRIGDSAELPLLASVVASLTHRQRARLKIDIRPFERQKLPDPQSRIQAEENPERLFFFACLYGAFDFFLLRKRETGHFLFLGLGAFQLVRRVRLRLTEGIGEAERALNDGNHAVDGICGQTFSRRGVAVLHELGDVALQQKGREVVELVLPQPDFQVFLDDLRVAFTRFQF